MKSDLHGIWTKYFRTESHNISTYGKGPLLLEVSSNFPISVLAIIIMKVNGIVVSSCVIDVSHLRLRDKQDLTTVDSNQHWYTWLEYKRQ